MQELLVSIEVLYVVGQASAEVKDLPVCGCRAAIAAGLKCPEVDGGSAIQECQLP